MNNRYVQMEQIAAREIEKQRAARQARLDERFYAAQEKYKADMAEWHETCSYHVFYAPESEVAYIRPNTLDPELAPGLQELLDNDSLVHIMVFGKDRALRAASWMQDNPTKVGSGWNVLLALNNG